MFFSNPIQFFLSRCSKYTQCCRPYRLVESGLTTRCPCQLKTGPVSSRQIHMSIVYTPLFTSNLITVPSLAFRMCGFFSSTAPVVTNGYYYCSKKKNLTTLLDSRISSLRLSMLLFSVSFQLRRGRANPLCVVFVRGTAVDGALLLDKMVIDRLNEAANTAAATARKKRRRKASGWVNRSPRTVREPSRRTGPIHQRKRRWKDTSSCRNSRHNTNQFSGWSLSLGFGRSLHVVYR